MVLVGWVREIVFVFGFGICLGLAMRSLEKFPFLSYESFAFLFYKITILYDFLVLYEFIGLNIDLVPKLVHFS